MASRPPKAAEYLEGPDAARRFDGTIRQILTVSKAELTERDAAATSRRKAANSRRTSKPANR